MATWLVFDGDDATYLQHLGAHPASFVLNSYRYPKATYLPLHTAECALIRKYTTAMKPGAFTEREFIKVWGPTPDALRAWIAQGAKLVGGDFTSVDCSCLAGVVV
ncbi:MAG: hypothetical protein IT340_22125 [Chloroflexi bacterium]|nr:hypothetical protein [Chloroflexota bacterium]